MNNALNNWMTVTPNIELLSLGELILPGAHNAGVDKKATYAGPGVAHWAACQNNSFYDQLSNGARALDARVEYEVDSRGAGTFWFQHNGFRSSRSLENLIMQVIRFLQENPDEFVLLDFHELKSANTSFDHKEFNRFLLEHLGSRIIPTSNRYLSLRQLKQVNRTQRVWLAAEGHPALDQTWFLPRIAHAWSGIATTSVSELEAHITKVMNSPPSWQPWSLSATSYSAIGGPVDIQEYLDQWFEPVTSGWIFNCSIINADFFEESNLVANCRAANRIKAQVRNT
ncbi:phospholipase [Pseudomonas sp. ANT_H12B]|uniref:phospholipase n=1 Tax=Pseudomonas sp. ANT_H12B TaxID=2597348 RepID=UPI0011ED165D|nr:phospholipase [Pseudomonas sp. ANT_H12B]KAA0955241.1 phospholipase [Pseudomonas sp. ANT_H12B]